MNSTTTALLRHVSPQFATRTVDATRWLDRTAPAQKSTVKPAGYGARPIATASSQQAADISQRIATQYLMLVGK